MADTRQKLEAVITASSQGFVDALKKASAAVNDSTASWKDRFSKAQGDLQTMKKAVDNLKHAAEEMGKQGFNADPDMMDKLESNVAVMRDTIATTGVEIQNLMDHIRDMKTASHDIGLPIDEYDRLSQACADAGLSMENSTNMITSMQTSIRAFTNGIPEFTDLFGKIGVTLEQIGSRSGMQNFIAIAEAMQQMLSPTEHADAAMKMFGRTVDDVKQIVAEYKRSLNDRKPTEFLNDKDVQLAIDYGNAIDKLNERMGPIGQKVEAVVESFEDLDHKLTTLQQSFKYAKEAYDEYLDKLENSEGKIINIKTAFAELNRNIRSFIATTKNLSSRHTGESELPESSVSRITEKYQGVVQFFQDMRERAVRELEIIEDAFKKTQTELRFSGKQDEPVLFNVDSIRNAKEHMDDLVKSMDKILNAPVMHNEKLGFIDLESIKTARDELSKFSEDYRQMLNMSARQNFDSGLFSLIDDIGKVTEKLKDIRRMDIKLRPQVDSKEIDGLLERVKAIRQLYDDIEKTMNSSKGRKSLESIDFDANRLTEYRNAMEVVEQSMKHVVDLQSTLNRDFDSLNEKSHGFGGLIRKALEHMMGFKFTAEETDKSLAGTGKQLLKIGGLLLAVRSANMAIVKGVRLIASAVREVALWWIEASKRQAEFNHDLNKESTNQFKENRKNAEDRMNLSKKYAESIDKANASGKHEDYAEAEAYRQQLWEKHGVRVDKYNARDVFKEQSENYYDEMLSQNEAETRMYKELVETWRKALKKREEYWGSVLGIGSTDLRQKLSEDTGYTDMMKKLGEAQKRLGELTAERTWLGRKRRGGEYADYWAVVGGQSADRMHEQMEKQRKERDKKFKEREKARDRADQQINEWLDELDTMDEEEKKIVKAMQKYEKLVREGGDRRKAYEALQQEIQKIREEAERKDVEELGRLADERDRELKVMTDDQKREADARKRLIESYKSLMVAQEAEAYRLRLDEIGKARKKLKDRMDEFGFKLPRGFDPGNPRTFSKSAKERRQSKIDASISKKLSKREKGERVRFTSRERKRLGEYMNLKGKDRALSAEERQLKAASKNLSAAKTMENATKTFYDAVKAFYEAQTGKKFETDKEKRKRERREKRQREIEKRRAKRRNSGWRPKDENKDDGRPRGWGNPAPAPKPGSGPRPAPGTSSRPRPSSPSEPEGPKLPSRFLTFTQYSERYTGDPSKLEAFYRKYVEMYDRLNGTKHGMEDVVTPAPSPEVSQEPKLPPEYDNATRHQRAVAIWNRRMHPEDYDEEGNWKYSEKGMALARQHMQEDAERELTEQGFMMSGDELARELSKLYAPPRYVDTGDKGRKDYTALLERIETAIKNNKGNLTLK